MQSHSVTGDGKLLRHDDPPRPIITWPSCPRMFETSWEIHPHIGGEITPADYMHWQLERDAHKRDITAGAAILFREWLRTKDLPEKLLEIRAHEKAKAKSKQHRGGRG